METTTRSAAQNTEQQKAPETAPAANLPATQAQPRQPKEPLRSGGRVAAIVPTSMGEVWRLAEAIAASGVAPKSYLIEPKQEQRGWSPEKIMVGIMHGMEVGFTPMAALQSIAVVNGMPTIWGDGALALCIDSGLIEDMAEWYEGEGAELTAHCRILRRGRPTPVHKTFSIKDASTAGLNGKVGPWQGYKPRMLQMRARLFALRDLFPDVLRGLYGREEVEDMMLAAQQEESGEYRVASDTSDRPTRGAAPAAETVKVEDQPAAEQQTSGEDQSTGPGTNEEETRWLLIDETGEEVENFARDEEGTKAFVNALVVRYNAAANQKALDTLLENNPLKDLPEGAKDWLRKAYSNRVQALIKAAPTQAKGKGGKDGGGLI